MTCPVQIALYQPDIAQNVGTIIRTAVCWGVPVHLIEPMGFVWNEPRMKRAGMDYLDQADITRHTGWAAFQQWQKEQGKRAPGENRQRLVALTTKGAENLPDFTFMPGDILLFGRESAGLPSDVHAVCDGRVRIPMVENVRSINLAQSAAVATYTALAQLGGLA